MSSEWIFTKITPLPQWLIDLAGRYGAEILWRRGMTDPLEVMSFLDPSHYQPTPASAFGAEMERGIERIQRAAKKQERVWIWGDFDTDGITATAVLLEGLKPLLPNLKYYIPDRLQEGHGLSRKGIETIKNNCDLVITCDTGSSNYAELEYLKHLGIDVIITDHHTLPAERPPVTAIINPRYLSNHHPLYHLSGVATAYKLLEGLYTTQVSDPQVALEKLLDLVAIGLIADLVELTGDVRYLAKKGLEVLKQRQRTGLKLLLDKCNLAGDNPTDISFGIAPRLNAVSRIWGQVNRCVELFTSNDPTYCQTLVDLMETANQKRKNLQDKLTDAVLKKISQLDLSTTGIIVTVDPEWTGGILGLAANRISNIYCRPVIVGTTDGEVIRASARSYGDIDLYQLIKGQEHLLIGMGGHPFACGLSLKQENLEVFIHAINQRFHHHYPNYSFVRQIQIDLELNIGEFNEDLTKQLKCLQPFGMGNPNPVILIRNAYLSTVDSSRFPEYFLQDATGKTKCICWDYKPSELPRDRCDVLVEFVHKFKDNKYKYQGLLIDWRLVAPVVLPTAPKPVENLPPLVQRVPRDPIHIWKELVGIAKYLARTQQQIPLTVLKDKLYLTDILLEKGIKALQATYLQPCICDGQLSFTQNDSLRQAPLNSFAIKEFIATLAEFCFRSGHSLVQLSSPEHQGN
ncbi:MAG: single-stranded-DNA-specific exonuclease RecJ [Pseudanabaenaceae cyanobacterium]